MKLHPGTGLAIGWNLKRSIQLLTALAALFTFAALIGSPIASADEGCPGGNPNSRPVSNVGGASFSIDGTGTITTYTFTSQDKGGVAGEGVPGLLEYCVYYPTGADPKVEVNKTPGTGAQGFNGEFFKDPPAFESFGFVRNDGNPSNIPFDGTTRTMGTGTWSGGAPTNQIIVLHINDPAECERLELSNETCFVRPGNPEEPEPPAENLEASKTAVPSFEREYEWEIEKEVDKTEQTISGGKAEFNYTVTAFVTETREGGWLVVGEITVTNPNSGDVKEVEITDAINDSTSTCEIEGGGQDLTIPGNAAENFFYHCVYEEEPESKEETNTATISWPEQEVGGLELAHGEIPAEASVDWNEALVEEFNAEVEVTDSLGGPLGVVLASDGFGEFHYTEYFEGVPGSCETYPNEASVLAPGGGVLDSANQEVKVCQGIDLNVEKDATPSFTRKYPWNIKKNVDKTKAEIAEGGTATFEYTIEVTKGAGEDSGWAVAGKITVENPNDFEDIDVNVTDQIDDAGATCTVEGEEELVVEVPREESIELEYNCTYSEAPENTDETNTATVTWNAADAGTPDGEASGHRDFNWSTPTTELDRCVETTDTVDEGIPSKLDTELCESETYKTKQEFKGDPAGECTKHTNVAAFQSTDEGSDTKGQDEKTVEVCVGADLTVEKTAEPSFKRKFKWNITKEVDKTEIKTTGSKATFHYTIKVTKGEPEDSGWVVKGTITVKNPNKWESIEVKDVADEIEAETNATCTVTNGKDVVIPKEGSKEFAYECEYSAKPASTNQTNKATATWDEKAAFTPSGEASGTFGVDWSKVKPVTEDNCLKEVKDTVDGVPTKLIGTLCESKEFKPSVDFKVQSGCVDHNNVAFFETETGATGEAKVTVRVCGPIDSGALTMGFWQNKNGQVIITGGHETSKVCDSGTWLKQFNPFKDLTGTSCKAVAEYVTKIIKAANAGGAAMNAMLKAQMLATALDVYFSETGNNQIKAPKPIGGLVIDLTQPNVTAAFGGAKSMTVMQLLTYAAGQSNSGGTTWYGQVKATQELAKNTFDAINNEQAFGP